MGLASCGDSIFEEVVGFSPFMVSRIKSIVIIVSCVLIVVLVILSVNILT